MAFCYNYNKEKTEKLVKMYKFYNPNPRGQCVGDCTVRAISAALSEDWNNAFLDLCTVAFELCDMPSANAVWGELLQRHGFARHLAEENTIDDFAQTHNNGIFVVAASGHVVTVKNGYIYDTWDSGSNKPIYYYWEYNK